MTIFIILLIFLVALTFLFRSSANYFDSALKNLFVLLSPLISLSNSSWNESEIIYNKSRTPSVTSFLLNSFVKNACSSLFISSNNMDWFFVSDPRKLKNNCSIGSSVLLADMFRFFLLFICRKNVEKCCFLALFTPKITLLDWFWSVRPVFFPLYFKK